MTSLYGFAEMDKDTLDAYLENIDKDKLISMLLSEVYYLQGKLEGIDTYMNFQKELTNGTTNR